MFQYRRTISIFKESSAIEKKNIVGAAMIYSYVTTCIGISLLNLYRLLAVSPDGFERWGGKMAWSQHPGSHMLMTYWQQFNGRCYMSGSVANEVFWNCFDPISAESIIPAKSDGIYAGSQIPVGQMGVTCVFYAKSYACCCERVEQFINFLIKLHEYCTY